jgi:hypothetical protein
VKTASMNAIANRFLPVSSFWIEDDMARAAVYRRNGSSLSRPWKPLCARMFCWMNRCVSLPLVEKWKTCGFHLSSSNDSYTRRYGSVKWPRTRWLHWSHYLFQHHQLFFNPPPFRTACHQWLTCTHSSSQSILSSHFCPCQCPRWPIIGT